MFLLPSLYRPYLLNITELKNIASILDFSIPSVYHKYSSNLRTMTGKVEVWLMQPTSQLINDCSGFDFCWNSNWFKCGFLLLNKVSLFDIIFMVTIYWPTKLILSKLLLFCRTVLNVKHIILMSTKRQTKNKVRKKQLQITRSSYDISKFNKIVK